VNAARPNFHRFQRPTFFALLLLALSLRAAPLSVDCIYPAGGQRGTTVAVTISGKFDKGPLHIWADTPALQFEAQKASGSFMVKIAPDAPIGPHLVRIFSADDASTVRCFVVGDQPETPEAEPNDEFAKPQPIKQLPALINGQLDKPGDVDCYALDLKAGQTFVASVQGRRLGSAIDPMLHLLDSAGVEVAYAQDGLGLDPLLVYPVSKPGNYVLRVSAFAYPPAADVKLAGGKDAVYRLSITTGPFVRAAIPSGVPRGRKSTIRLVGYNLAADSFEVDATSAQMWEDHLFIPIPGGEGRRRIELSDGPEIVRGTGSDTAAVFSPPVNVSGVIDSGGVEDQIQFAAKKGERLNFQVRAEVGGSPLDAILRIRDQAGKELATNDDTGTSHDPKLDWDAPADGTFRAGISDLFRKGGPDYLYRLEIRRPTPQIEAAPDADAYLIAPGKTAAIKLQVTRKNGHAAPLMAVAINLPASVTATSAEVPAKGGEVTLTLTAAADAKPASGPIRLMLLGADPNKPEANVVAYDLRKDKDKPGIPELIDRVADIWLTVSAALPPTKEVAK
jgi:hypothetical protein